MMLLNTHATQAGANSVTNATVSQAKNWESSWLATVLYAKEPMLVTKTLTFTTLPEAIQQIVDRYL